MSAKTNSSDTASGHACDAECKTKARIIAVAERMIAEHGVQSVSIRDLSREAGVNLAAINYHFGSKNHLVAEVLARRITALNAERMTILDAIEADGGELTVELVVEAVIRPLMRTDEKERNQYTHTAKMLSRFFLEPDDEIVDMLTPYFLPFKERLLKMLARVLPAVSKEDVEWRTHQVLGLLNHHMLFADVRCKHLGKNLNVKKELRRLVAFCSAGLKASPEASVAQ